MILFSFFLFEKKTLGEVIQRKKQVVASIQPCGMILLANCSNKLIFKSSSNSVHHNYFATIGMWIKIVH